MSIMMSRRAAALLVLSACAGPVADPAAPPAEIVALGASNTEGFRVARSDAYPAQLEALLRAEGRSVSVANAGISGDSTANMLRRLDAAVAPGARVVLLQPGGNDSRSGEDGSDNVARIRQALQSRGVRVIMVSNAMLRALPDTVRQPDGVHYTPEGYRMLAQRLLPQVREALDTQP